MKRKLIFSFVTCLLLVTHYLLSSFNNYFGSVFVKIQKLYLCTFSGLFPLEFLTKILCKSFFLCYLYIHYCCSISLPVHIYLFIFFKFFNFCIRFATIPHNHQLTTASRWVQQHSFVWLILLLSQCLCRDAMGHYLFKEDLLHWWSEKSGCSCPFDSVSFWNYVAFV